MSGREREDSLGRSFIAEYIQLVEMTNLFIFVPLPAAFAHVGAGDPELQ